MSQPDTTTAASSDQPTSDPANWGGNSTLLKLLGKVLPPVAKSERLNAYNGPLSTFEEYHAVYIGLMVGYAGGPAEQQALTKTALYGWTGAKASSRLNNDEHIHDAVQEPAYASFGLMVGQMLRGGQFALPNLAGLAPA